RGVEHDPVHLRELAPAARVPEESLVVELREEVTERVVDAAVALDVEFTADGRDGVVTPELPDRVGRARRDGQPELRLDRLLLRVRETHEHVVVDQLVVTQGRTRRVEALESLLRVRIDAEIDRHVLEPAQPPPEPRDLTRGNLAAEERVIVV